MRVLLIMPNFFDYPQLISSELEKLGYEVDFFDDRPSSNAIVKAIIRIKKDMIGIYIKSYFNKIMKTIRSKKYDFVLLISGQSLSFDEEMIAEIKRNQLQAHFVLYQWDSMKNFPQIQKVQYLFDDCYSFDKRDVKENANLKFLPLFYSEKYEKIGQQKAKNYVYDFSFVGTAHPKKYKFIKEMSCKLKDVYKKQFIYFFFPSRIVYVFRKLKNPEFKNARYGEFHFSPISGEDMIQLMKKSKCILDSAQDGQEGLTIRVLEALGAKKKLITTNADVMSYDFYKKENIYVYKDGFDFSNAFFTEEYHDVDINIYEKYALRNWLKILLEVTNDISLYGDI